VEFELLGWPPDGPTLRLDYRQFSYAGKFVMSNTGKAVARVSGSEDGEIVAAVSFNEDRTDPNCAWLRYVTVREDYRGDGLGPQLAAFATDRLHERGYERVRIAVNNPFAYQALYRAGFAFTGEETGIAELVLCHPGSDDRDRYRAGLERFRGRDDLSKAERSFLDDHRDGDPPTVVDPPA